MLCCSKGIDIASVSIGLFTVSGIDSKVDWASVAGWVKVGHCQGKDCKGMLPSAKYKQKSAVCLQFLSLGFQPVGSVISFSQKIHIRKQVLAFHTITFLFSFM